MALIKCPECGKEVSDKAQACIHCGYPFPKEEYITETVCEPENKTTETPVVDKIIDYLKDKATSFVANPDEYERETKIFIREIAKTELEKLVAEANRLEQLGDKSLWDKLAVTVANIDKQISYYSGWPDHQKLYEFVKFDKIQVDTQKEILNILYGYFEEKPFGDTNHITYWYPIYKLLVYGTEEIKNALKNYLSSMNITNTQTRYNDVMDMVNKNLGAPNLLQGTTNTHTNNNQINTQNVPKCPTCGSPNINKISGLSKAGSVAMWGLFSRKVHKQWHCNNCGSEW